MEITLNPTIISLAIVALLAFSHATMFFIGFGVAHSNVAQARNNALKEVINAFKGFIKPLKEDAEEDKNSFKGGKNEV